MKITNVKSKLFSIVGSLSIAGLVLAGVVVAPTSTALAQTATPPAKASQQVRDERLERVYLREQNWLSQQQKNLGKTSQIVSKVQTYIANQQANGKDVSALKTALETFQQQIAAAQASHTTAASVLGSHAGFDANGKVTDPIQARQTLLDGRQALGDAHLVLRQAILDLHRALRTWRQANGLKVLPAIPPSN